VTVSPAADNHGERDAQAGRERWVEGARALT
jgi:hypothetical protein